MDKAEKLKRIILKTESGSKWFDDPTKLSQWIQEQRKLYQFFTINNVYSKYGSQQIYNQLDSTWQNLYQISTNELQRYTSDPTNYNNSAQKFVTQFQNSLSQKLIYTNETPFSDFIIRQAKKKPEYAVAAVSILLEKNLINIDSDLLEGLEEAKEYLAGSKEREEDENNKLEQIKNKWDKELQICRDDWVDKYNEEIEEASKLNDKAGVLIKEWREQVIQQSTDLENSKQKFIDKFTKSYDDSRKELEQITKTYDDKLALHASVRYWGIQQKQHQSKTLAYGIALGVSVVAVVIGLVIFSNSVLDYSIKDIHISRLVTAGVLTTFGIWLIKILSNIFMSHMHLATDAQERRTMIHTYLALTRKGQGPKEEDRLLILQTLFRPSASGMVKDDAGPSHLVDMVNRLVSKSN